MDIPLDEVIHFDAISSSSTGAAADADSTPTFAVYEESTDTDIGVGGNMTKRTSLTGNYRGSFTASAANGFELGKWYNVIGSATIGGVACKGVLMRFRIIAAEATAGYNVATLKVGTGTGEVNLSSGKAPATIAAGDIANSAITAAAIATGAIDADALATDGVQEIRDAITGGAYALSTDSNGRVRIVDGTGAGELSTTSGFLDWSAAWDSEVQSEAQDAIEANHLDHLFGVADPGGVVANNSFWAKLLSKSATAAYADYDNTTDSLQAIRDRGDAAWITATGFSTHSAADVWAVGTRTLTALGFTLAAADLASGVITNAKFAAGAIDAAALATDAAQEIRNAVTGGAYPLDTDANGRVRIVDGTAAGELDTASGLVKISGTIQTLDALDTAQDAEHDATQAAIAALNNVSLSSIFTTQLTESYAANGTVPTLTQAILAIHQMLMFFAITGTSFSVKKFDGTQAFVGTLNDATNPTALSRAA